MNKRYYVSICSIGFGAVLSQPMKSFSINRATASL